MELVDDVSTDRRPPDVALRRRNARVAHQLRDEDEVAVGDARRFGAEAVAQVVRPGTDAQPPAP